MFDSVLNPEVITSSSKLMYELTVFVLTVTRENHSLAFVFSILYRFQGSVVALSKLLSSGDLTILPHHQTSVNPFFELFSNFFEFSFLPPFFPRFIRHSLKQDACAIAQLRLQ